MESVIFSTLLHSLWEGAILGLLAALVILCTAGASAKLRYNLFAGCLVLFIAAVGTTFCMELNNFAPSTLSRMALGSPVWGDTVTQPGTAYHLAVPGFPAQLEGYLSRYSSWIVLVWLLVICVRSIRLMADIRALRRIRTSQVYHAGTMLAEKVEYLAAQYGINQKVQVLQSGLIKVPMVLGHFKPLILIPLGLINGLSVTEVDAILSHEMAHIKRRDYLVNILQSAAEIVFFFNPAVLWVSELIKTEREHCCDDLAVAHMETKADYIKALVSCQEFAAEMPSYVMAVNGGKSKLVHRVQRLISLKNQSLNKLEKVVIGLGLIVSVAMVTAFSGKEIKAARVVTNGKEGSGLVRNDQDHSDALYNQMIRDGLAKADADLNCTLDKDAFVINGIKQPEAIHAKYAKLYLKKGQKLSYSFEKAYAPHESQRADQVKEPRQAAQKEAQAAAEDAIAVASHAQARAAANAKEAQARAVKAQQAALKAQNAAVQHVEGKNDMTKDLIAEGLIRDKTNLSYQLNQDELVIDGQKQPEAIHKKYVRKYLKSAGQKISVSVSTN